MSFLILVILQNPIFVMWDNREEFFFLILMTLQNSTFAPVLMVNKVSGEESHCQILLAAVTFNCLLLFRATLHYGVFDYGPEQV